jgi:hypothetical protein
MADMRRMNRRCYPLRPVNPDPPYLCCLRLVISGLTNVLHDIEENLYHYEATIL